LPKIHFSLFSSTTLIITVLISLIAYATSTLTITATTDKQTYNAGETVKISGNLTLNGALVPDALVALQVDDPKGSLYTIRTRFTGSPSVGNLTIEVLQVYLSDEMGNPQSSVRRGILAYFTIIWRNNDNVSHEASITLSLYYGNAVPFLAFVPFKGTVPANKTPNMTAPVPIPNDASVGEATVYGAAFTSLPKYGGLAYCPEKSSNFTITATSGATTTSEGQPLTHTSTDGTYNLTFSLPRKGAKLGTNAIYATSEYQGEQAAATHTFEVKLEGDVNGDGVVDIKDVTLTVRAYGATPDKPNWNPACDLNNDSIIDVKDITIVLRNYGNSGTY
jgi:hypothetical protein